MLLAFHAVKCNLIATRDTFMSVQCHFACEFIFSHTSTRVVIYDAAFYDLAFRQSLLMVITTTYNVVYLYLLHRFTSQ